MAAAVVDADVKAMVASSLKRTLDVFAASHEKFPAAAPDFMPR